VNEDVNEALHGQIIIQGQRDLKLEILKHGKFRAKDFGYLQLKVPYESSYLSVLIIIFTFDVPM